MTQAKVGYIVQVREFSYLNLFSASLEVSTPRFQAEVEFLREPKDEREKKLYEYRIKNRSPKAREKYGNLIVESEYKGKGPERLSKAQAEKDMPALLAKYEEHYKRTGERLGVVQKAKDRADYLARVEAKKKAKASA